MTQRASGEAPDATSKPDAMLTRKNVISISESTKSPEELEKL